MKEQENNQWFDDLRRQHLKGSTRNPGAAALMSFFVMGLGQIYAGHIDRGIMLMAIYFGGIFSAFSAYNGGMVYNAAFPLLGAHLMVIISYFFSVVFILLWIYNIKDAYYLSLFSSFRDWFEVERVLLPVLQNNSGSLIAGPSPTAGLLTHSEEPSTAAEPVKKVARAHEDADVVEVSPVTAKVSGKDTEKDGEDDESLEPGQVAYSADFGAMRMHSQSWKLYLGLAAIFILVGIWLEKRGERVAAEQNTLFAVAAEIPSGRRNVQEVAAEITATVPVADPARNNALPASAAAVPAPVAVAEPQPQPLPEPVAAVVSEIRPTVVEAEPAAAAPFDEGLEFVKSGDYSSAAAFFATALEKTEPDKAQWRVILNSFYRAEAMADYEKYLRRYLETFSDDATAWFNLGKLLYDRSELAQASQAIVRGLRSEPDNVRGNFLLGSIYIDLKLFSESITYLEKALALEPLNVECNRQLARALNASGKAFEARRYFQRILSLVPDDLEASQALAGGRVSEPGNDARVLIVQGKGEGRLVEKQAVDVPEAPVSGKVLFDSSVSQVVPAAKNDQQVDTNPLPAAQLPAPVFIPSPEPAQIAVAPVPQNEPKVVPSAPLPVVSPAPVVPPVTEKVPEETAVVQSNLPQHAGVELYNRPENQLQNQVDKAVEPAPQPIQAPVPAAIIEKNTVPPVVKTEVKPVKASEADESSFMDAVAQEPDQQSIRRKIEEFRKKGAFEFSRGNWEAALPHYLEVLRHKKDAQTYDMIGVIFEKLSMHKDAFDAIEHSYQLGRRDPVTLTRLGRLAETTGNYVKGEKYLQQALQKSPHRVDLRIRYAKCLEENGNREKAIAELEKIARAGGDSYALKRRAELEINRIRSSGK